MFLLGFYIGNMLGGPVKQYLGYGYNFSFGMLCSILAVAWCVIFVKESKEQRETRLTKELGLNENDESNKKMSEVRRISSVKARKELQRAQKESKEGFRNNFYGLFLVSNITAPFITVFKKREGNQRMYIILTVVAITLDSFAARGKWSTLFLYLRKVLSWNITQYSSFMSSLGLLGAISNYILVPIFSRKLLFHDSTISIIDTATAIIKYEHKHIKKLCNIIFTKFQFYFFVYRYFLSLNHLSKTP